MTARPRILIVDDEKPITVLLAQTFANEGHQVANAHDGIDCLNKMASFQPDVVIMDIMMPRLDGVDTTRMIRNNRNYGQTIIIALSACADEQTCARIKAAGIDLFMRKPFSIAKLVERVALMLAARAGKV